MEYYSAIEKEELLIYITTCMNLWGIMLSEIKQSISQGYILYDSIYKIFLKWQNFRSGEKISGCLPRLGKEVDVVIRGQQKGFLWC